jgi:hypothetical protein
MTEVEEHNFLIDFFYKQMILNFRSFDPRFVDLGYHSDI